MVYRRRVGVDQADRSPEPRGFLPVIAADARPRPAARPRCREATSTRFRTRRLSSNHPKRLRRSVHDAPRTGRWDGQVYGGSAVFALERIALMRHRCYDIDVIDRWVRWPRSTTSPGPRASRQRRSAASSTATPPSSRGRAMRSRRPFGARLRTLERGADHALQPLRSRRRRHRRDFAPQQEPQRACPNFIVQGIQRRIVGQTLLIADTGGAQRAPELLIRSSPSIASRG